MSQGIVKRNLFLFGKDKAAATRKADEEITPLAVRGLDAAYASGL